MCFNKASHSSDGIIKITFTLAALDLFLVGLRQGGHFLISIWQHNILNMGQAAEDLINRNCNLDGSWSSDFLGSEKPMFGTLRITNPKTLAKWKADGRYQELIDEGFIYAKWCGRFRKEECTCSLCRKKYTKPTTLWNIYDSRYHSDPDRSTCFVVCHSLKEARIRKNEYGNDNVIVKEKVRDGICIYNEIVN
jgi:hypothetical protein